MRNRETATIEELRDTIDSVAIHMLHILWLVDSEHFPELKHYFDCSPRGLMAHIGEINKHLAESGCKIAQTGKIESKGWN